MQPVKLVITQADVVEAAQRHHRAAILSRRTAIAIAAFTGVLMLIEAAIFGYGEDDMTAAFLVATGVAVCFPVFMYAVMASIRLFATPRRARRHFAENKALQAPADCSWNADSLRFERPGNISSMPWTDLLMFRESPSVLMLYLARGLYLPLPKSCFSDEALDEIRALLAHAGVPRDRVR